MRIELDKPGEPHWLSKPCNGSGSSWARPVSYGSAFAIVPATCDGDHGRPYRRPGALRPERASVSLVVLASPKSLPHRERNDSEGRPRVAERLEKAVLHELGKGHGIHTVARVVGVGTGTVQRIMKRAAMA
jgi:hypothetical protein